MGYVVKPIESKNIKNILDKIKSFKVSSNDSKKILGKRGDKLYLINIDDIYYIKADLDEVIIKIKEADLKKHLEGELNKVDDKIKQEEKAIKDETKKIISKDDLMEDNQLNTSLAILKSLIIMNK